jgi:myosin heavy subunit
VFTLEQEEYNKEGIDWNEIKFKDNKPLLDLFLKPIGLLGLLDEECTIPKVSILNMYYTNGKCLVKAESTTRICK